MKSKVSRVDDAGIVDENGASSLMERLDKVKSSFLREEEQEVSGLPVEDGSAKLRGQNFP